MVITTRTIYKDFVRSDMIFDKLEALCTRCRPKDYGFLVINLTLKPNEGKYVNKFEPIRQG